MANERDMVMVIGDVGVETIHRERTLWMGAGGSALNVADMLCGVFNIRTYLLTRADLVLGWQVDDALSRFHELNETIARTRLYIAPEPRSLREVNSRYADLDVSTHLAFVMNGAVESVYSGRDIDLTGQTASLREAMGECALVVVDTRLTRETLRTVSGLCQELSLRLIVVRNGREQTLDKFVAVGEGGGCQLLVLDSRDAAVFGRRDPCEAAGARLVAYVNPEGRSWSVHRPDRAVVVRGNVALCDDDEVMDTIGALEGFTAGYIAASYFEGYVMDSGQAAEVMNEGIRRALRLIGGNTLSLRDAGDPASNVTDS